MTKTRKYPDWICHDCGIKFGKGLIEGGRAATYHLDTCDCCGAEEVPCTEPRDYGGFPEWPLPRDIDPMPIPETLEDLVEPVLKYFNFERVHSCMTHINWQWFDGKGPGKVPTVEQLNEGARELLLKVCRAQGSKDDFKTIGTGGLFAHLQEDGLRLEFVLSESEAYLDDYS